jgi:hypothetical protein
VTWQLIYAGASRHAPAPGLERVGLAREPRLAHALRPPRHPAVVGQRAQLARELA